MWASSLSLPAHHSVALVPFLGPQYWGGARRAEAVPMPRCPGAQVGRTMGGRTALPEAPGLQTRRGAKEEGAAHVPAGEVGGGRKRGVCTRTACLAPGVTGL